jgi:uncharacterized protein
VRQSRPSGVKSLRMPTLELEVRADAVRFRVRVKPRASKSRIVGIRDGVLEVAIAAPPVDGAANSALIYLLAGALELRKSAIEIVSGQASRSKLVSVVGFTPAELVAKLKP